MEKKKDWTGSGTIVCLGAHNRSTHDRETHDRETHDYYATQPEVIDYLFAQENFVDVWECACGEGHLSKRIDRYGVLAKSTDIIERGYGEYADFLTQTEKWHGDIITNPPYRYAKEFILKALELTEEGRKIAMFLRVQFLESRNRYNLFTQNPPKTVYVFSGRMSCAINGDFNKCSGSA